MSKPSTTHLTLPDRTRRMAAMEAARMGVSLSEYIAILVHQDARLSGVAALVEGTDGEGTDAAHKSGRGR